MLPALLLALVTYTAAAKCHLDRHPSFSGLSRGDECQGKWADLRPLLRPTQNSVGYAWVFRIYLKDMTTEDDAQDTMDGKTVPVVLHDGAAFVVDHHHHLAALDLSGFDDVDVTLYVSCDLSGTPEEEVWTKLASQGLAYLYGRPPSSPDALPTPVSPSTMPSTIDFRKGNVSMADDRWRALSGFSRKVNECAGCSDLANHNHNYACRAYNRVCASSGSSIPFFEYRWAYMYDDAANFNTSLWSSSTASQTFAAAYSALSSPTPSDPVSSVDDWSDAAALLVPLARGGPASSYTVPASMGLMAGKLLGYRDGMSPFDDDDPDCDLPAC